MMNLTMNIKVILKAVEAQILAFVLQSEGLHEIDMVQGGFDYVKSTSLEILFFCVCTLMNLCYSK